MAESSSTRTSNTSQPHLTPRFCFDQAALRDFLRLSRASVDDTITSNLNALLTPSLQPFQTRTRQPSTRGALPSDTCTSFTTQVLFPAWSTRDDVLTYCADVAAASDHPAEVPLPPQVANEDASPTRRRRVVDERLDPYSARVPLRASARTEELAALVGNERTVEQIVRARTWGVVRARCRDGEVEAMAADAEEAFGEWRAAREGARGR